MSLKVSCLKDAAKVPLEIAASPQDCLNCSHCIRNEMELFKILDWPRKKNLAILVILTTVFIRIRWDLHCWMGN